MILGLLYRVWHYRQKAKSFPVNIKLARSSLLSVILVIWSIVPHMYTFQYTCLHSQTTTTCHTHINNFQVQGHPLHTLQGIQ